MINVERIPIDLLMPNDEMRFVAMQPFIKPHSQNVEPFRWRDDAIDGQIASIERTLEMAKDGFNGRGANFTLFPEYAVPGMKGVETIGSAISSATWPNGNVVIAGIHGVSKKEYSEVWQSLDAQPTPGHLPDDIPKDQWVNCCAIWVKDMKGSVRTWIQPKVQPSWPERSVNYHDMFRGLTVYLFECEYELAGYPCRFFSLICYDWIATIAGSSVCEEVLQDLNDSWDPNPKPLHWVFLIQHNDRPNHSTFLNRTYDFFIDTNTHQFVERSDAIVVQVNTAISTQPSGNGDGGFSACIFSPRAQFDTDACRPTVCMQPDRLRGSDILHRCHDVVFREMGECIHAFKVTIPKFITSDATGRAFPLPVAEVHPFTETDDPRLPGGPVPADTKWLGDSLDVVSRLSNTDLQDVSLGSKAATIESELIGKIRLTSGHSTNTLVNWAACDYSGENEIRDDTRRRNADLWNHSEKDALEHIFYSLTSLGLVYEIDIDPQKLHALIMEHDPIVQIVAIRGESFKDCLKHYDERIKHSISNSVLVILRNRNNTSTFPGEFDNILDPENIRGDIFVDYQTISSYCREAESSEILKGKFDAIFPKHDQPII